MILTTDINGGTVRLDDTPLPGIFQSLSVNGDVIIDSGASAGNGKPRKVMRGFGDKDISLNLVLLPIAPQTIIVDYTDQITEDIPGKTVYEQLEELEQLFKSLNRGVPKIFTIANDHIQARRISNVVFKSLASSETSASEAIEVSLSFEEFREAAYDGSL